MNVTSTLWCFHVALFFGCAYLFRSSDCFTISADYGQDDVEFTCVISPYPGNQNWYIDSALLAGCGGAKCLEVTTNPSHYSFELNTTTGIFIFKIDHINSTDEGRIVGCSNGTYNQTLTIAFQVRSGSTSKSLDCFDYIWCIIIFIVVVLAISYIPAFVIGCNKQRFCKVIKGCNLCILIIPCLGLILITIYCCLLCKGYRRKNKVKPSTPICFTCDESSVTMTSFKVLWTSASNGESGLKFLLVWSTGNEKKKKYIPYENNNDMEYVIRDLIKDTSYYVKICAKVNGVKSVFTENLMVTTLVKPRTPIKFTYDKRSVTISSFKVRWEPAPDGESGCKFLLVWSTDNEKEQKYIPYKGNSYIEHEIQNLKEATKYNVEICAEVDNVKSEFTKPLTVKTLEGILTQYNKKHQRIAGEDEICCENCKETRGAHASHALCLSHRLYLCLTCIGNEHKNEKCVLLWNTGDIEGKDHKLCCEKKYNYDDLQLKGVCQVECKADNRQTDKLFICSQCIKETEYPNSTSHQQLHGPLNTRVLMCCEKNKTTGGKETVNFCIQCKTYVCAPCLNKHKKHLLISSLKKNINTKPSLCCELNEKTRGIETDFCIQCNTIFCASCLESHNNNHMVITSLTGLVSARAGVCCETGKDDGLLDFCIQCQTFLSVSCSTDHHSGHIFLSSFMNDPDGKSTIFCKGCESKKGLPIECLELTKSRFLCSSCYEESENLPKKGRRKSESEKSLIKDLKKKTKKCQVHGVLGDDPHFVTNVYCLICKLYMCMGCYKKHRRLYEYWSKYLEGNLFYCNHCPTAKKVKLVPVECYDLQSSEFMCGNCYIFKRRNKTSYPDIIKSTMKTYTDTNKQCKLHEDLPPDILLSNTSSTANVFCLVCKEYMCKTCFGFHVDRNTKSAKSAWLEKDC